MDPKQLKVKIERLKSVSDTCESEGTLPQETYSDCTLTFVAGDKKFQSERYTRLCDILQTESPLLIACKSNGFFKTVEKVENADQSLSRINFITTRSRSNRSSRNSSKDDNSSVCGSPLKLDIIADLSGCETDTPVLSCSPGKVAENFGLPQSTAKKLISLYSVLVTGGHSFDIEKKHLPTVIAICDGHNVSSKSVMALKPLVDQQNNLLGVKITDTVSKPLSEKSVHVKQMTNFPSSEVTCRAKYDLLADCSFKCNPDLQSFFQLELEWKKETGKTFTLLHEPPMEANSVARIQKASGSADSPLFPLFKELVILCSVIEGLGSAEVQWRGTQESPLIESVKDLVEQLKRGSDLVECKAGEISSVSLEDKVNILDFLEERKDLDFTDQLWKVLQGCTSYVQLVEALNYIVAELRRGDLQPFIHVYNKTSLGQMVKDSYRGALRAPSLSGLSPLQYLAEIGSQKLLHDYIHLFLSRNLADIGLLEFYTKENLELEECLDRLERLHNTMEVLFMLQQSLDLPQNALRKSCRQMLKHYESHGVDPSFHFTFAVPTKSLAGIVERFQPTEWKAEGVKMIDGIPERLVYNFTTDQLFDWLSLEQPQGSNDSSKGDADESSYYLTVVKDSVNILC